VPELQLRSIPRDGLPWGILLLGQVGLVGILPYGPVYPASVWDLPGWADGPGGMLCMRNAAI
jgi:hypothetical protein